ncbi:hypothetical protein PQQ73_16235 [Paraburkholderia strydomiana]|uniref:DUF6602 domain-containing protein n=1 Tax=Paraburkholderia strydomiana TaxID=1245417 RepID=A0ABW9EFE3_9BURK
MNTAIRSLVCARIRSAIAAADAVKHLQHSGLKGLMREILVRELLAPILPPTSGIGHGEIVDSYEAHSTQQDVVIYDKSIVPSVLLDATNGIFPIESAIYAIEVKSKIDAGQLKTVHDSAKQLSGLLHDGRVIRPKMLGESHENAGGGIEHVIPCLFAFSSDLSGTGLTELQRYEGILGQTSPALRAICVVGKGYWFFQNGTWHSILATDEQDEVIEFLGHIHAAYERVAKSRVVPRFSHYIGNK